MATEDELRNQNWAKIHAQLTTFAWTHTGKRSWEDAQDLAQHAIADAFERIDGWDPAEEPLLKNLCRRVIGLATNSRRRKRNTFEVAMRSAVKAHGVSHDGGRKEIDARWDGSPADEMLDQLRLAESYRERLYRGLAGDEAATVVLGLFKERVDTQAEQVERSGLTLLQVRAARRRLFRLAESVSNELAQELDSEEVSEVSP